MHRIPKTTFRLAWIAALLLLWGCGGSSSGGDTTSGADVGTGPEVASTDVTGDVGEVKDQPTIIVDTNVDPPRGRAGESYTIQCSAVDEEGTTQEVDFDVALTPDDGGTLDGFLFTPEVAGTYHVACAVSPEGPADESPFVLEILPAAPVSIAAFVDPSEITAGDSSEVTCSYTDEYGNVGTDGNWVLDVPSEGFSVDGLTVTVTVADEHEITCHLADGSDEELDNTSATLTVVPGEATHIALKARPNRPWFALEAEVTVTYEARDAYENAVPGVDYGTLTLVVDPTEGITDLGDNKFRFDAVGRYDFSGTVPGPPEQQAELTLYCDPDRPVLTVTEPERGLTLDGADSITIAGTIVEEVSGLEEFSVNGTSVPVAADGAFSTTMPLGYGMNLIRFEARDGVGHELSSIRSVYYSQEWHSVAEPSISEAALLFADREFFLSEDTEKTTLSSAFATILQNANLAGLLPSPAASTNIPLCSSATNVYVSDVSYVVGSVILNPRDGGLHLYAQLDDLRAYLELQSSGSGLGCINEEGYISGQIIIIADLMASVDASGTPHFELTSITVRVNDLTAQTGGLAGAIVNLGSGYIEGILGNLVEDIIVEQLASVLAELVGVLALDLDIDLDPFIGAGTPVPLHIQTRLQQLDFTGGDTGAMRASLSAAVTTPKRVDRDPLGSIGRADCLGAPETFALPEENDVEIALRDDALNEALFAVWWGGRLDLDMVAADLGSTDLSQFGITDLAVQTHGLLAPILHSCNDEDQLLLQLGDYWIHATFGLFGQPVDMTFYAFAEIEATLVLADGEEGPEPGVEIGEIRTFDIDIVDLNEEMESKRTVLVNLLTQSLPQIALDQLADGPITFALPAIDLSSLDDSGLFPEGLSIRIVLDVLNRLFGYTMAAAHIEI